VRVTQPLPPGRELRERFALEPGLHYLNHGGFGGVPRVVAEAAADIRDAIDANPTHWLTRVYPFRLIDLRERLAAWLRADADGLVFVPNATAGMATAIAGLGLGTGDEVVTTDHAYGAVRAGLTHFSGAAGASVRVASVPLDVRSAQDVVDAVLAEVTPRTRALVVDHVASPTGMVLPVQALVEAGHERGLQVVVDGAHALAMLDVDLSALGADVWVGNLHKWLCAPRTSAVMAVAPQHRAGLKPLVPSHGFGWGLQPSFDWTGTFDPAPMLASEAALAFHDELGWDQVRERQRSLARDGAAVVAEALGTEVVVADDFAAAMRVVRLPAPLDVETGMRVERRLRRLHQVEVPLTHLHGEVRFVRVSGALYNEPADYEALAAALPEVLAGLP
jgi:isopenicillin-N epimerase